MDTSSQSAPPSPAAVPALAPFERAYQEFLQALHALATGSGLEEQLALSYAAYHRALEGGIGNEQAQRAGAEAYAWHMELLRRALLPESNRQRALEAFQRYVEAVRGAWAGVDARGVPPAALGVIAQSLMAAAMTTAGVIGPAAAAPAGPQPSPR